MRSLRAPQNGLVAFLALSPAVVNTLRILRLGGREAARAAIEKAYSRRSKATDGSLGGHPEIALPLKRVLLFLIGGGSAAVINLSLAYVGVELLGFRSDLQQNYVNIAAMEVSLVYSFLVYRAFVWRIRTLNVSHILLRQLPLYHLSAGAGVLTRIALFPWLQSLGLHYLLNISLGILAASAVNYALSTRFVFKDPTDGKHP